MVATIKFSQFAAASLANTTNKLVGVSALSGGSNFYTDYPLTWATVNRPTTPPAGTLGYNTSLGQYEYWNGAAWVQFSAGGSGSVNLGGFNQLAIYNTNPSGTSVNGLMNSPSSVLTTTSGSVPQWATTLPAALTLPQPIIQGVTNASNAAAGVVGEFISSEISNAGATTIAINSAADVTSISLTAGDWDVWGNIQLADGNGTATIMVGWTSSTSASLPDPSKTAIIATISAGAGWAMTVPYKRYNISSPITVYLSVIVASPSGSMKVAGGIFARRAR